MFKDESSKNNKNVETIIGPSVKVEGDFLGDGDVIVEGIVIGNVKTKNHIRIGKDAKVQAEITAKTAFIAGEVNGNITVEENIDLTSTSKIKGNITTHLISIEKGASINGHISTNGVKKTDSTVLKEETLEKNK